MSVLYFAYGSNMYAERMKARCQSAMPVATATLHGYRLVERLYADIEPDENSSVQGVVWKISQEDLERLDTKEGCQTGIYRRVTFGVVTREGWTMQVQAYEMTEETKTRRNGMRYPEFYRKMCEHGATQNGIRNQFERKTA